LNGVTAEADPLAGAPPFTFSREQRTSVRIPEQAKRS
jgi:hypothetical protein